MSSTRVRDRAGALNLPLHRMCPALLGLISNKFDKSDNIIVYCFVQKVLLLFGFFFGKPGKFKLFGFCCSTEYRHRKKGTLCWTPWFYRAAMTESLIIGNFAINFFNFPKHPIEKKMFWKRSEKDVLGEKKCYVKVTFFAYAGFFYCRYRLVEFLLKIINLFLTKKK